MLFLNFMFLKNKIFAGTQIEFFNIDLVSYNLDKCY